MQIIKEQRNIIPENVLIDACNLFSNKFANKLGKLEWNKARSNIYVTKLDIDMCKDVAVIVKNPKIECKATKNTNDIIFEFFYIWKLKSSSIKKLQYYLFATLKYDLLKNKFEKLIIN